MTSLRHMWRDGALCVLVSLVAGCVITIPTPTPVPAPVPPVVSNTSQYSVTFDRAEPRANWSGSGCLKTAFGIFTTVYNYDTRCNAEVYLNGAKVYAGSQETIGQGLEFNGKVYFPAEGTSVLYDGKTAHDGVQLRHSACATMYLGQPCFVSSEEDGEWVLNADTGVKVKRLAVGAKVGIPLAACAIPNSTDILVALGDAADPAIPSQVEQLVSTADVVIPLPDAMSVASFNGVLYAAGKGVIYTVDLATKSLTKWYDTGSQKVNCLWVDTVNGVLWITSSGSDQLFYFDTAIHRVAVFGDEPATGNWFDSRVTPGWYMRDKAHQAMYYKVGLSGTPPAPPPPATWPTPDYSLSPLPGDAGGEGSDVRVLYGKVNSQGQVSPDGGGFMTDAVLQSGRLTFTTSGANRALLFAKVPVVLPSGSRWIPTWVLVGVSSGPAVPWPVGQLSMTVPIWDAAHGGNTTRVIMTRVP